MQKLHQDPPSPYSLRQKALVLRNVGRITYSPKGIGKSPLELKKENREKGLGLRQENVLGPVLYLDEGEKDLWRPQSPDPDSPYLFKNKNQTENQRIVPSPLPTAMLIGIK